MLLCTGMRQRSWRPPEWRLEKQFKVCQTWFLSYVPRAASFTPSISRVRLILPTKPFVWLDLANRRWKLPRDWHTLPNRHQYIFMCPSSILQVLLSTRRGGWLLNRQCRSGEPADRHFHSRWHSQCRQWVPKLARSKFWEWTADSRSLLAVHPSGDKGRKPSHSLLR